VRYGVRVAAARPPTPTPHGVSPPSLHQPIHLPDWVWQRPEVRRIAADRDVGALFRLAQQYASASQARIAAAVGISQGRVNEIINRRRAVTNIDVLLRVVDGLHLPDDARMVMGLAPARTSTGGALTHSAEIAAVYPDQASVAATIRRRTADAAELDLLAVRGLGLVGLNDSLLRPALSARTTPLRARVVLLDPDCPAARQRASEIGESPHAFAAGIRLALTKLQDIPHTSPAVHLELALHTRVPVWRIIRLDDVQYISAFTDTWEGHKSTVYEIPHTPRGAFSAGFRRMFDDIWANAKPATGGDT
jgi:hypothetical protein